VPHRLPSDDELKEFAQWGVAPPSHEQHGVTPDNIRDMLEPAQVTRWWLEGNELCAESQHGFFRQTIPTNMILTGTDDQGLPVFKKIA
jgi:hypothetical protein